MVSRKIHNKIQKIQKRTGKTTPKDERKIITSFCSYFSLMLILMLTTEPEQTNHTTRNQSLGPTDRTQMLPFPPQLEQRDQ